MKKLIWIFLIVFIFLLPVTAYAGQVNLAWDENTETVSGYRVYATPYDQPFDYSTSIYEGSATTCSVVVQDNTELKFVARAYLIGESGAIYESEDSNQVQHAVVVWVNPNLRIQ